MPCAASRPAPPRPLPRCPRSLGPWPLCTARRSPQVLRIRLPESFAPSLEGRDWYSASLASAAPTTWLAAAVAAVPISFFFFMDQALVTARDAPIISSVTTEPPLSVRCRHCQPRRGHHAHATPHPCSPRPFAQGISSLLCQLPEMGLQRGAYFHSSFVALAVLNLAGPLVGCPFVTG